MRAGRRRGQPLNGALFAWRFLGEPGWSQVASEIRKRASLALTERRLQMRQDEYPNRIEITQPSTVRFPFRTNSVNCFAITKSNLMNVTSGIEGDRFNPFRVN